MPAMPPVEQAYAEEAPVEIPRFGILAHSLQHSGSYANPYREVSATTQFTEPGGTSVRWIPLFWDGGTAWRLRFSPDVIGTWQWHTRSNDSGLDGASGTFEHLGVGREISACTYRPPDESDWVILLQRA